jgi:hypothetical protein
MFFNNFNARRTDGISVRGASGHSETARGRLASRRTMTHRIVLVPRLPSTVVRRDHEKPYI